MKLVIDPASGMAGDMLVAALLDAGAPERPVIDVISFAGNLIGQADFKVEKIASAGINGSRLITRYTMNQHSQPGRTIEEMLVRTCREFRFASAEADFAERALGILCQAEALAHRKMGKSHRPGHHEPAGEGMDGVHLHEAQDIVVDVAGSAKALALLGIDFDDIVCLSPVFYGGGTVTFSHGTFPVPAPAVKEIIAAHQIPVETGPVPCELLTPTGAALLAALSPRYRPRVLPDREKRRPIAEGRGVGTRELVGIPGQANGLAVRIYEG